MQSKSSVSLMLTAYLLCGIAGAGAEEAQRK